MPAAAAVIDAGTLGVGSMATGSDDASGVQDSSSASPRSGGVRAAVRDLIHKPKEMIQVRSLLLLLLLLLLLRLLLVLTHFGATAAA
jgi:hypothetical protein